MSRSSCAWLQQCLLIGATAWLCLCAQVARAEDRDARAFFELGLRASRQGDFAAAADAFEHSRALSERPSVLRNLAVALDHLGRFSEALAALDRALELGPGAPDVSELEQLRAGILTKVVDLTVEVTPSDAEIELDGKVRASANLRCDPGEHVLRIRRTGFESETRQLTFAAGARVEHVVLRALVQQAPTPLVQVQVPQKTELGAAPAPAPMPVRTVSLKPWAVASLSLAVVAGGTGAALWLVADKHQRDWEARCARETCSTSRLAGAQAREDRLDRSAFAMFGLAGAAGVLATTLFFLHPRERKSQRTAVSLSPTRLSVSLRF